MATSTTNYSFTLPEVGGDTDQWGNQLNANWTSLDSTLKTVADSVGDDVSLTGNDYLTISGQAITVGDVDLTADVTGTLPVESGGTGLAALGTANQVLAVNATADGLEFQTVSGSGTVTSVSVSGSDGIEIDSGSPVTTSGTIALGINSTTLSTHLGLGSLATQSTITESQISDLGSYITASSTNTLANKSGAISQWTNDSGYLTAETNDLSAAVTWANVPDANITQSSVTQHQAALSITESQISDFGSYQTSDAGLTSIAGLTTAADKMIYTTAADTYAVATLTTAGRALLDDVDAAAQRTTLGLGSAATSDTSAFESAGSVSTHAALTEVHGISAFGATLVDDADAAAARNTLGVDVSGTDNSTPVSLVTTSHDYLSLSSQTITLGPIVLTTDVSGTLGTANGGTGLTTIGTAGQVLKVNTGATALEFADESGGGGLSDLEHANSVTTAETISSGNHRFYVGPVSFSNTVTIAGKLLVLDGLLNTTGTINTTGTLHVRG